MREIKYRGKSLNGWVYGYYVVLEEGPGGLVECIWKIGSERATPIVEKTLGQYTGLKDKNGVEIYEGDYFQDDINIWEVGYQDSCFVAKCLNVGFGVECLDEFMDFETHQYCDVEVIGNIYENPELLEEE